MRLSAWMVISSIEIRIISRRSEFAVYALKPTMSGRAKQDQGGKEWLISTYSFFSSSYMQNAQLSI
jgi:hypothetical protein